MEAPGGAIRYLSFDEIIDKQREIVLTSGGFQSHAGLLLNENSLRHVVEIVQAEMYGTELYLTLAEKAAVYAHGIAAGHVFYDGNKRTGMACALFFLQRNGADISRISDDDIISVALGIAEGSLSQKQVAEFFQEKIT